MLKSILSSVLHTGLAIAAYGVSNQCGHGSSVVADYRYCGTIERAKFSDVGTKGSYQRITGMDKATGRCTSQTVEYSGPLAPFDEGLSVHLRGPINLKQFAVYMPQEKHWSEARSEDAYDTAHRHQLKERNTKRVTTTRYTAI